MGTRPFSDHSDKVKEAWERGAYDDRATEEYRQKLSKGIKAAWARGAMDGIFQSPTSIEIAVANALDQFSLKHQSQWRPPGYSKVYDEFIHPNILVEVQGSYWHSPPDIQERDLEKARWAEKNGYKFIAIWDFHLEQYGAESLVEWWILPLNPEKDAEERYCMPRLF